MTAKEAERISREFTIVERARMRETLSRIRDAGDEERRECLRLLLEAVRAPIVFPVPLAHDEGSCAFRTLEANEPRRIADSLVRLVESDRSIAAVALCHFSTEYRDAVWDLLPSGLRASTRPLLAKVPAVGHARTRRHAQELARRVESDSGARRARG